MTTEQRLSIDEFIQQMMPYFEQEVDSMILEQPLQNRMYLMKYRDQILQKYVQEMRMQNFQARIKELEERLKPRLVE